MFNRPHFQTRRIMCALVVRRSVAERIFKNLKGIFAIYKPRDMTIDDIKIKLRLAFAIGLNERPCRPTESMVKIDDDHDLVYVTKNLADSPLAVGFRYIKSDFKIDFLNKLSPDSSGVQICSVNDANEIQRQVYDMRLLRVYEVEGRLGVATHNFVPEGRLIEKSTYGHVSRAKMDRLMGAIQSTYQREMYRYFGIDVQSQESYELASSGLLRPKDNNTPPIIYSIRCIDYRRPYFKYEIHIINETCTFLKELTHDIGYRLNTNAICTKIRRTRDGFVDVSSTLPYTNWSFDALYDNLKQTSYLAYNQIKSTNKTVLLGTTKNQELHLLKRKNSKYLIDLREDN